MAEEIQPPQLTFSRAELYVSLDDQLWLNRGVPYNWTRIARYKELTLQAAADNAPVPERENLSSEDKVLMLNSATGLLEFTKVSSLAVGTGDAPDALTPADMKSSIVVQADSATSVSINWQTDLVPGDTRTFAQKHGNSIGSIDGIFDDGNNVWKKHTPNYSCILNNGIITVVNITEVFPGIVTII